MLRDPDEFLFEANLLAKRHVSKFQWKEPAKRRKLWDPLWVPAVCSFVLLDPWRIEICLLEHSVVICIVNFQSYHKETVGDGFWCPVAVIFVPMFKKIHPKIPFE